MSDWSRITWRVVGRCVLGETVGLGVESRLYSASWDFMLNVMGNCYNLAPLRNKCQE